MDPMHKQAEQDSLTPAIAGAGVGVGGMMAYQHLKAAPQAAQAAAPAARSGMEIAKDIGKMALPLAAGIIAKRGIKVPGRAAPKAPTGASVQGAAPAPVRTVNPSPGAPARPGFFGVGSRPAVPAQPTMTTGANVRTAGPAPAIGKVVMASVLQHMPHFDVDNPAHCQVLLDAVDGVKQAALAGYLDADVLEKAAAMDQYQVTADACDFLKLSYGILQKRAYVTQAAQLSSHAAQLSSHAAMEGHGMDHGREQEMERQYLATGNHPERRDIGGHNRTRQITGTAIGATAGYGLGVAAERMIPGAPQNVLPAVGTLAGGFIGHEASR